MNHGKSESDAGASDHLASLGDFTADQRLLVLSIIAVALGVISSYERGAQPKLVGMIGLVDLLEGRRQNLEAERRRERVLSLRVAFPKSLRRAG